ncbi:methyltransferase-like protein 7A [Nephila pilipes]|uniref:Methyltransferase-like protein 7A n=1 Tax=Nephila pilipes TaxID=299642 RepID=A0A8X6UKY4_NEPPI|nr:methyltransferase-like protein 7A [Nephila pilipes]
MWFSWFTSKCFFLFYDLVVQLNTVRRDAFELLKEHLSDRKKSTPHDILEIGIADGANLQFYPENSRLTALDKNASFETYLIDNLKKHPQVQYKENVIAMAENMVGVEDSSFDVVVCTLVLCSVDSIRSVLKEVKRVLKPGGKFLFLEHVSYPISDRNYWLQFLTAPLWHIYFCGCNLIRKTGDEIKKSGFSSVEYETNTQSLTRSEEYLDPLTFFIRIL